ncbi:PAP2 family protein [Mesorhizobium sp. B3-1-6]|uniref:phosphatase PAP2 family protein n=1 Tax=Mesorhizobium sp. B3-1-6 TaxID=2589895 RepID=UPI001129B39D|nr:phosphatase PAP2 family protein [Mesorhizobium sp. B3-1-6]TPI24330.1 PAP2 family protein [Mesorhizobium sp. B3-1-6]
MDHISKARWSLAGLTIVAYCIVFLLAWIADLEIRNAGTVLQTTVLVATILGIARMAAARPRFRAAFETSFCGLLLVIPIVIASYLAVRVGMPWADNELQAMDQALGVDWLALLAFVDARKYLSTPLNVAYASFAFQLLLLPLILASSGSVLRSYQVTLAYAVICFVSAAISVWYPALGTYAIYHIDPSKLQNINGKLGVVFLDELQRAHDSSDFVFDFARAEGIMTFPSVHAAIAALCAWAAWGTKWLRYPILILNMLMAASAAIVSNHYAIDIVAGIGVAGLSIGLVLSFFGPAKAELHFAAGDVPSHLRAQYPPA